MFLSMVGVGWGGVGWGGVPDDGIECLVTERAFRMWKDIFTNTPCQF